MVAACEGDFNCDILLAALFSLYRGTCIPNNIASTIYPPHKIIDRYEGKQYDNIDLCGLTSLTLHYIQCIGGVIIKSRLVNLFCDVEVQFLNELKGFEKFEPDN